MELSLLFGGLPNILTGTEPNLVGYWKFEDNTGTTTVDSSINSNDGTLNGDMTWPFSTKQNTPLSDTLASFVSYDSDGDAFTYIIVDDDGGAAVIDDANTGAFTYTPNTFGTRTFTYKINDGIADSNIATVTVEVISLVVSSTADTEDGNYSLGQNTLREAIANANAGNTITFDPSIAGQTITLTSQLNIAQNLTIDGTGQKITISGNNAVRVFEIISGTVTFNSLTIANGNVGTNNGGGIRMSGTPGINVTINNCTFTGNSAKHNAGIDVGTNGNTITVNNSTFVNNSAVGGRGAGLSVGTGDTATVNNSTFSNNSAAAGDPGAGIVNYGTLNLKNTIIANSTSGGDCKNYGTIATNTNNIIMDGSCSSTFSGDPLLSSLADNGGDTQTMALLNGSLAINAGDNGSCEATDQRSATRPKTVADPCDIGAYEIAAPEAPTNLIATTASESQINLSWTDNSTSETGFKIERAGSLISTTAADATNYNNSSLSCETTYSYSVKATDGTIDSAAATASATTSTCPITVYYKLTIEKIGNGNIVPVEYGINCGDICEYDYADQTELTLIATPDTGWLFNGWTGDCDSNGEILINKEKACTATFITSNVEISTNTVSLIEGISKNGYSLSLNFAPTGPVTITFENTEELIFEPTSLTFDASNWDILQTVQITDVNDDLAEGLHEHIISHIVTSDDNNFNNLQIENVIVQVTDDDSPNVHLSINNIIINESDVNSYNIVLASQPIDNVSITLSTNGNTTLNPTTLVFTTETWNIPQDVTVSVEDDKLAEGEHKHNPIQHQVSSEDLNYKDLEVENVTVNIIDNDISNILLSTYNLNFNEGESDNITVALTMAPTQPVTVNFIPEAGITLSPKSITFDDNNWNNPQTIAVVSIEDEIITNEIHTVHINTTSVDINYNNLTVESLIVNVTDNDKPNVLLSSNQITVFEEGAGSSYTLVLAVEPTYPVTINLTTSEHSQVSPNTLVFTSTNWNIKQTVNVIAVNDDLIEEDTHINTIVHKISSDDVGYTNLLIADVIVNIVDSVSKIDLGAIILICQDCSIKNATLVDIASLPASTESYSFPESLVTFELETSGTAHLDIYYKNINSLDDFIYRKYGPTTPGNNSTVNWYNLSNVTFGLADINDLVGIVKVSLTLTDGQLGDDTGVDGIIIDDGGIAVPDLSTTIEPLELVYDLPIPCNVYSDNVNGICDVGQNIFPEDINIGETGSVSYAVFKANVNNLGLVANSVIDTDASLTGGYLSGTILNKGIIENITFIGTKLSGGILSGNIINESQIGGIIQDVYLASGTVVRGGKVAGTITGNPIDKPVLTDVIIMPGTVLSNVHLSPTVRLSKNVILGEGVSIATKPYTPADFGLSDEYIANLTAEQFSNLELEALAIFTGKHIKTIPAGSFSVMTARQMSIITGFEGLTTEQFAQIPIMAFSGLTSENMGDLPIEVLQELTPEHIETLNEPEFEAMLSENVAKFFVNTDFANISLINRLVPKGWTLDLNSGKFVAPFDFKLNARYLLPKSVNLPYIVNMRKSIGVGGYGKYSLLQSTVKALDEEDLTDFVLSQDENGILNVKGTGPQTGKLYTFIPDADNIIQVDTDEISIGLSVGPGGFYTITTPEGQQFRVIPAPKDPVILSEVTDSEVRVGKRGDVIMKRSNRTRSTEIYLIAIFDPFVEDFIQDNLCIEIRPGELECDVINQRKRSSHAKIRKIKYPDGTAQTIRPTVLSPDVFIEEALKFEGVEQVVYKADGTFAVLYQGKSYFVHPNFTVQNERISEPVEPSIVSNSDGSIRYSIAIETEIKTRSTEVYEILFFDLFLEIAPNDLCIEIMPGELECDF
ncbi:choice-of-anchor Q domain-containing protein [Candidatus Halobeggiatoa sp. HSG11]|nr:choice-of-anchor Q domain-containing protein [Candidatus Halobeggiatoa sp. HSG11]